MGEWSNLSEKENGLKPELGRGIEESRRKRKGMERSSLVGGKGGGL